MAGSGGVAPPETARPALGRWLVEPMATSGDVLWGDFLSGPRSEVNVLCRKSAPPELGPRQMAIKGSDTLSSWNLFTYRDLWQWIDKPFETPPEGPPDSQLAFF
jgi:hypothetical protein